MKLGQNAYYSFVIWGYRLILNTLWVFFLWPFSFSKAFLHVGWSVKTWSVQKHNITKYDLFVWHLLSFCSEEWRRCIHLQLLLGSFIIIEDFGDQRRINNNLIVSTNKIMCLTGSLIKQSIKMETQLNICPKKYHEW